VCWIGIVEPSFMIGAEGEPGWMSTKKLPSRKIRERTWAWASLWIGSALSLRTMVTCAAPSPEVIGSTFLTLPNLDAGYADRRVRLQVVHVVEDGVQLVGVRERVRLREAEVPEQRDHGQSEDSCAELAHR